MAGSWREGDDTKASIWRVFIDDLHLDQRLCELNFDIESVHEEDEIPDWTCYPGLPCFRKLLIAKVRVLQPPAPKLSYIGLPAGAEFQTKRTGIQGTARCTWMWSSRIVFERAKKAISLDADKDETNVANKGVDSLPMEEYAAKALGEEIRTLAWLGRYANAYRALVSRDCWQESP